MRIDRRLLAGPDRELGERAVRLLTARLVAIAAVVPAKSLEKLREVPIQLDLTHGALRPMQYHPSAAWLRANGYSATLEKNVHIPDVREFVSPFETHRQPWAVLHELAHYFFDHPQPTTSNPSMASLSNTRRADHWFFDGLAVARRQLERAGVLPDRIHATGLCTASHPHVFCSYRRDGRPAGRMAGAIRRRDPVDNSRLHERR